MVFDDPYYRAKPEPTRNSLSPVLVVLLGLIVFLLTLNLWQGRFTWPWQSPPESPPVGAREVVARGDLANDEKTTIELFKKASPSVVHITTLSNRRSLFSRNIFQVPEGTGSGFIWDKEGHVVTNYHVLQNADAAEVTLADRNTYPGQLVGILPDKDLAILKVEVPKDQLVPITLGTSSDLQVGQKTFAIGNPFGLDFSLTTGIVSALGREIEAVTRRPIKDVIQTDAAINPGNSGGPLLDSAGRLIGVNTAIYSPSGTSAGIGFAIPVDEVNKAVPNLLAEYYAKKPRKRR